MLSAASVVEAAEAELTGLKEKARKMELESLLSGEADSNDCYIEVHAGAGGTEAQDWADILLRMYTRWANQHGYKVEWLEGPHEPKKYTIDDLKAIKAEYIRKRKEIEA